MKCVRINYVITALSDVVWLLVKKKYVTMVINDGLDLFSGFVLLIRAVPDLLTYRQRYS